MNNRKSNYCYVLTTLFYIYEANQKTKELENYLLLKTLTKTDK